MGLCNCSTFCCALLYVLSSYAIILMEERELVTWLLGVSLFLTVPWVCLKFVILVFPDHTIFDNQHFIRE